MDPKQFDTIARALGNQSPRRALLKALGGGLVGTLVGVVSANLDTVAHKSHRSDKRKRHVHAADSPRAKCKGTGRPCAFNTNCCSETCCNKVCCAKGQACDTGQCVTCQSVAQTCGTRECGSVVNDCGQTVNCGSLGGNCPQGKACNASGTCETTYSPGTCTAGQEAVVCATVTSCNGGDCLCSTTASGTLICRAPGSCTTCSSDADCAAVGAGYVCVNSPCCIDNNHRSCARPCST
jgi:hypothetical protein